MTHWPLATSPIHALRLHGYFPTLSLQGLWRRENKAILPWFLVHGSLFWCPHLLPYGISFSLSIGGAGFYLSFGLLIVYLTPVWDICHFFRSALCLLPLFSAQKADLYGLYQKNLKPPCFLLGLAKEDSWQEIWRMEESEDGVFIPLILFL